MSDKTVITFTGFGCLLVGACIAAAIGGFIGIIIAVAKWVAS